VVRKRLDVYHAQTKQLIGYYSEWADRGVAGAPKYRKVPGVGALDEIRDRLFASLT
jgi:adenylate kinase